MPFLSLQFANPAYFLLGIFLLYWGRRTNTISRVEAFAGSLMLLIPYIAKGYDMAMTSQARYGLVVYPNILTIAKLCAGAPRGLPRVVMALSLFVQFMYAIGLGKGHSLY
jgi:hypothetical protein